MMPLGLSQVSQTDKYHMIALTRGILKMTQMNIFMSRNRLTDIENKLMVPERERGWGMDHLGVWD